MSSKDILLPLFDESWIDSIGADVLYSALVDVSNKVWADSSVQITPTKGSDLYFKAFRVTPLDQLKVVILGMDPYPDDSYNGLSFGNGKPNEPYTGKLSPSLRNIMNEIERCYGSKPHPSLYNWANQGVLLINTAQSLILGQPGSHMNIWKPFTELIVNTILTKTPDTIWMMWGKHAQGQKLDGMLTICTGHPSPLNRTDPFVGSDCFVKCNEDLVNLGKEPINWTL